RLHVLEDPEQGEGPRAGAREVGDGVERVVKQLPGEALASGLAGLSNHCTERPQRAPMTVFAPARLDPLPRVAHEVAKPRGPGIEGVAYECQISTGQGATLGKIIGPGFVQKGREDERSSVVIDAISILVARNGEHRVLQYARVVSQRFDVAEIQLR